VGEIACGTDPEQVKDMTDQTKGSPTMDVGTRLAFDRTRLAYDRTMMAWIRTATSLISFGFSIYKFFQIETGKGEPKDQLIGPREFAMMMIGIGLLSLLMATIQHRQDRNELRARDPEVPLSMAAVLAGMIALLGIVAFAAVIFQQ
jgi:putative membrane protein